MLGLTIPIVVSYARELVSICFSTICFIKFIDVCKSGVPCTMIGLRSPSGLNARGDGRARRSDAVAQEPPPITFVITERPNRESDDSDEGLNRRTRAVNRNHNTYLEGYLDFHYDFGIAPFRLNKNGEIATSRARKVRIYCLRPLDLLG